MVVKLGCRVGRAGGKGQLKPPRRPESGATNVKKQLGGSKIHKERLKKPSNRLFRSGKEKDNRRPWESQVAK